MLTKHVDARPHIELFRVSMDAVTNIDVAFASEAIASLVQERLGRARICLVHLDDADVLENIAAAAERTRVPINVWSKAGVQVVGPPVGQASTHALAFALDRVEVRAAEFAKASGLSITNASTKFKQLCERGYLMRREATSASGGTEFVYRRIG